MLAARQLATRQQGRTAFHLRKILNQAGLAPGKEEIRTFYLHSSAEEVRALASLGSASILQVLSLGEAPAISSAFSAGSPVVEIPLTYLSEACVRGVPLMCSAGLTTKLWPRGSGHMIYTPHQVQFICDLKKPCIQLLKSPESAKRMATPSPSRRRRSRSTRERSLD